jgi:cation transport protein ChaC
MTRRPRLSAELVRRVHRDLADPGPMQRQKNVPKSWFADTATSLRAALAPGEPLWVFAFGSLIWRAPIAFSERRTGLVRGWHRAFCLGWDTRYRGNVDQPGLMLSLDRGGSCKGVALKIAPERLAILAFGENARSNDHHEHDGYGNVRDPEHRLAHPGKD